MSLLGQSMKKLILAFGLSFAFINLAHAQDPEKSKQDILKCLDSGTNGEKLGCVYGNAIRRICQNFSNSQEALDGCIRQHITPFVKRCGEAHQEEAERLKCLTDAALKYPLAYVNFNVTFK